jgi:hypothetical protein
VAITKITPPTGGAPISTGDYNAQNAILTAIINSRERIWLTEMGQGNTNKPDIIDGLIISHAGAFYKVTGNESISGSPSDGRAYVKLTESAGIITASFVTSSIGYSWDSTYSGFYHPDGTQLIPVVISVNNSGAEFYKLDFFKNNPENENDISSNINAPIGDIQNDNITEDSIFETFRPLFNFKSTINISGYVSDKGSSAGIIASKVVKINSTTLRFYGSKFYELAYIDPPINDTIDCVDGNVTNFRVSISW